MTISFFPNGWLELRLGEIGDWVGGGTPSKQNPSFWEGHIPWVSPKDMKSLEIEDTQDHISDEAVQKSSVRLVPEGSILFVTRSGILAHSFPVASTKNIVTVNQDIKAIVPYGMVFPQYLAWALRADSREILNACSKHGTTVHSIEVNALKERKIGIPPKSEQKRIVTKIEELFSEIDNGIAALTTAREQLKVYRQAVLKHAFEGKLTAQWREDNKDKLETPEQLLARIQQERQARYQQQLDEWKQAVRDWEADGEEGKRPGKPTNHRNPLRPKDFDLVVPHQWTVSELADIAYESILGKMLDMQKNSGIERPYLGNINVRWGRFKLDCLKKMRIENSEVDRYALSQGDLVICEGGEPGRCAIWNGESKEIFIQKALHRVRFTSSYLPRFAYYYFVFAVPLERVGKHLTGTTIMHLTGTGLSKIQLPVCSTEEQKLIIEILDAKFTEMDRLDTDISEQIVRSETLRQSILKKAFSGQLVPQDPNDEPASVLLARIQTEKTATQAAARTKSKPKANSKKSAAKRDGKVKVKDDRIA